MIGAGPAGSYAAMLLAKQGHDVTIFERSSVVGQPVACTGIVTKALWDLVDKKKEFMVNELSSVEVFAPDHSSVDIPLHEFVIDRHLFDSYLARQAVGAGAVLHVNARFVERENDGVIVVMKGKKVRKKADIVIGADGPLSPVAKSVGIYGRREFWAGLQVTLKKSWNPNKFLTYFGSVCPGFFAWVVPENESIARVGLAARRSAKPLFDRFINSLGGEVVGYQPGPIPVFSGREIVQKDSTYLVGDAAGLVKATTGGGIITGMLSSKILADCIEKEKDYSRALWPLKKELYIHKFIRRTLDNFSEQDYNKLVKYMNAPRVKDVLQKYPREFPSKFLLRLLVGQPRFVSFAHRLWMNGTVNAQNIGN